MILIADSGSTKTNWCIHQPIQGKTTSLQTSGINPFYQDETAILATLKAEFTAGYPDVQEIHFYGAGCANPEVNRIVETALREFFQAENIEVGSDLVAAARALCQHEPGIACIMGTGSNSCYYNGKDIENQISPLGFILGDEGSGAVIGKRLLSDILKNQLPGSVIRKFFGQYQTSQPEIMENIYRKPFPNRYAAQFTRFIGENLTETSLRNMVRTEFELFFRRNVLQYPQSQYLPVHFSGSVAWHFRDILRVTAETLGLQTGTILRDPMEGLLKYHQIATTPNPL